MTSAVSHSNRKIFFSSRLSSFGHSTHNLGGSMIIMDNNIKAINNVKMELCIGGYLCHSKFT